MATSLRPRAGSSAKVLLLTILGELVLPAGGSAWTQSLVAALEACDIEQRNARQAIGRLADQGIIDAVREGRRARWSLTAQGETLLVEGTRRIYAFGADDREWDGRWLTVVYSVPGPDRAKRQQLRSRLAFAGFGFLGPNVAITPHLDREAIADDVLRALDLVDGSVVLRAEAGGLVPAAELVGRAWDLDSLAAHYRSFIDEFSRVRPDRPAARFAALVALVHHWRRFPFIDAEIPPRLLPTDWPGGPAKELFDRRHEAWVSGARAHWAALEQAEDDAGH